ncbi:Ornithine cyclodeaminase [Mucinivorans hirudinis]|uniref:Ornithine cyclodeaminase n=1 Tax=Mucinivorans hirudinis TaxID=1433126 RepID=A0A060RE47_9BACT|nr:Ornithine cyclodeaminase [Mucinivorans hirudinis]
MKIIKHSDIEALKIPALQYVEWVEQALMIQYECQVPAKISVHLTDDGFFNTMPCLIPSERAMGVKVVNRYKHNSPSIDGTIMLYNSVDGELRALMDGTLITAMRTGAVAATSVKYLKNTRSANKVSMMGLGVTARATMMCLLESMPEAFFDVKLLRYKEQAELFAERFAAYENVKFTIVDSAEDLIVGAEVIISCITSASGLIGRDEWFGEGVLLVPVHTRGFQNCDLFFDKVFGDVTEQICHFGHFDKFRYFDEFAKVVQGKILGRDSDNQRILVYNIGQALHDIFVANKIMDMVARSNPCDIAFKEPVEKFYI